MRVLFAGDDRAHLRSPATEYAWTIAWYADIVGVCSSAKLASLGSAASASGWLGLRERCAGGVLGPLTCRCPAGRCQCELHRKGFWG